MSLRKQLLLFGLLTLVLPWAGLQYVKEMESALRSGLEQSLLASANAVARALETQRVLPPEPRGSQIDRLGAQPIYAHRLAAAPRIDGSRGDWNLPENTAFELGESERFWTGVNGRFIYLFLEAADSDIVYQRTPGQAPYGDRLVMLLRAPGGDPRWLVFGTAAPGVLRAQLTSPPRFVPEFEYDDRVLSTWQETAGGFLLEARVPLSLVADGLGVALIDVDTAAEGFTVAVSATWDTANAVPGELIYQRPEMREIVSQFETTGDRFRVIDPRGWVLADTGAIGLDARLLDARGDGLTEDLVRYLLRRNDPPYDAVESPPGRIVAPELIEVSNGRSVTAWYRTAVEQDAIVAAAVPVTDATGVVGGVLLEQASDSILTVTNRALLRLMSLTLAAALAAMLGMLGFATYLSFRIGRLARAAERALGPKGEIETRMPGSRSGDEIGALARSFGDLLARLREHTVYLRTLTSKLSHELRTPLAVVSTSLDNLEQERVDPAAEQYVARLRQGANRLDAILAAMSAATRMEQAIASTSPEVFHLDSVIDSCCTAYRDVYAEREFVFRNQAGSAPVRGSRELIEQLMDKLIDNAVGFSPAGSLIEIELSDHRAEFCLAVMNPGSVLPEKMRQQIFDSLVSVRDRETGEPHLGLGLYIAALIVEFHGGRIKADNLPDESGVRFEVWLPREG